MTDKAAPKSTSNNFDSKLAGPIGGDALRMARRVVELANIISSFASVQ
jgi:hypothetical protein